MLRRRIPNYNSDTDDIEKTDLEITFNNTVDKPKSVDSSATKKSAVKNKQTKSKRDSIRPGRRTDSSRQNHPGARPNQRNGHMGGYRQTPVSKPVEVDEEGDYVDTGMALPGDVVGIVEEFKAGKNTFKRGGNIIAMTTGAIRENHKRRVLSVIPSTSTPPIINVGDTIIAKVFRVKDSVILLDIDTKKGAEDREILTTDLGEIHVSNISNSYIKDTRRVFSQFDIVKAKVIDANSMRLSTADDDCGVLKALCSKCLTALDLVDEKLGCPSCGNVETRKMSSDYGTGMI